MKKKKKKKTRQPLLLLTLLSAPSFSDHGKAKCVCAIFATRLPRRQSFSERELRVVHGRGRMTDRGYLKHAAR